MSSPPTKVTIAIIGAGSIGPRHAQSVLKNRNASLHALVDPSPHAAQLAAQLHTAIICTPNTTHVPIAMQLASAGIAILVEKPLNDDISSARSLLAHVKSHNVKLIVGHHRRFQPCIAATQAILSAPPSSNISLGRVLALSGHWAARKPAAYFAPPLEWNDGMLWAYHEIGRLYYSLGQLVEAEQMYQRALQGYEKAWGPEHTSTLDTVNNLGLLYSNQGKLVEAEQMYQRALQGYEKAWALERTAMLNTVNNLGMLYKNQGKLVKAEQMYQRALEGYEKALGADIAITYIPALNTIWNLGSLFEDKSDSANAKIMYSKALIGFEKVVGPDHSSSRSLRDKIRVLDEKDAQNGSSRSRTAYEQSAEGGRDKV